MQESDNSYAQSLQIVSDAITNVIDISGEEVEEGLDQALSQLPEIKIHIADIAMTIRTAVGKIWHSDNQAWVYKKIVRKANGEPGKTAEPHSTAEKQAAVQEFLQLTIAQLVRYVQERLPEVVVR